MLNKFKKLSGEKKWVIGTFLFLITVFSITALAMESKTSVYPNGLLEKYFSSDLPAEYTTLSEKASSSGLKAIVKGSIYEPGSNMTVFGACFDGDGFLLPDADAKFSAWYPNGTILMQNATMFKIYDDSTGYYVNGTGRWGIHVTMGDTVGTYLTELRCTYEGDWAISFGEWQNPEWVQRIRTINNLTEDTNLMIYNVSNQIVDLKNTTENGFSNVTTILNSISVSGGVNAEDVRELRELVQSLDMNMWVLDDNNPYYVLGSGVHSWSAVDILNENSVVAVSSESDYARWDGSSWENTNVNVQEGTPGQYEFTGVSQLSANVPYAWIVGKDTVSGNPIMSVNGAAPTSPGFVTGNSFNDIKLFQDPNNPSGDFFVYVLEDNGVISKSEDSGSSWSTLATMANDSKGRISQVVENYDVNAQLDGYTVMIGQGNEVVVTDGTTVNNFTVSGIVKDVSLLYYNIGYVVVEEATSTKIYKYDGSSLSEEYEIQDASIVPVGVSILAQDDVWVATQDPSVFYHFNGRTWEYSRVGYSDAVSVIINFGGSNATVGLNDVDMQNSKVGYAVGSDGMILVFKNHYDVRFDDALNSLINITNNTVNLQSSVDDLYNLSVVMNSSIQSSYDSLYNFLDQINTTVNYKLDNVLQNVTYTQLYLDNTLFPLINGTYENTILILQRLGILEAKINQTIELQNQTLGIVNSTAGQVDILVNKSNRIHAWVQH